MRRNDKYKIPFKKGTSLQCNTGPRGHIDNHNVPGGMINNLLAPSVWGR